MFPFGTDRHSYGFLKGEGNSCLMRRCVLDQVCTLSRKTIMWISSCAALTASSFWQVGCVIKVQMKFITAFMATSQRYLAITIPPPYHSSNLSFITIFAVVLLLFGLFLLVDISFNGNEIRRACGMVSTNVKLSGVGSTHFLPGLRSP